MLNESLWFIYFLPVVSGHYKSVMEQEPPDISKLNKPGPNLEITTQSLRSTQWRLA